MEVHAMKASRIALGALALLASAAYAGTAEVRFIDPGKFSDLGNYKWEESVNMDDLSRYVQKLAQRLPPDQVLHVDVLDVDLAGEPRDTRNGRIRVARDSSFPVIQLRYTLEANGRAVASGEERLTDLEYRHHLRQARASVTSLYYEKRMLDDWFDRSFTPQKQAYAH
jgi:hypothetical protein